nr:metal ABC transporter substrate-binding protein [uncultured Desulfobulbus sp.]
MHSIRSITFVFCAFFWLAGTALAATPLKVVASFSILGDMVTQLGGDTVEVVTLVGPDEDAHVFEPSPADAKVLKSADLVIVNGLGFEGWLDRLVQASGFSGKIVVASAGIKPRAMGMEENEDEHEQHHGEEHHHQPGHGHDDAQHGEHEQAAGHHHHHHGDVDPHAWQSLANGMIYAHNISKALIAADPAHAAAYQQAEASYVGQIKSLESWVTQQLVTIPEANRRMITSHDAFGYFGDAYGVTILSPVGVTTASEASAGGVKELIRQIKREHITAVFVENISDRRLIDQIAREAQVQVEGELYSDALSKTDGPAASYLTMFRSNVEKIVTAMRRGL